MDTRRRTYVILIGIILLTIPCYLSGIALLARAPNRGGATPTAEPATETPTPSPTRLPPSLVTVTPPGTPTPQPTGTASITPTPSATTTPRGWGRRWASWPWPAATR